MHPHHEIDVISVMVEGEVAHKGSLEHGAILREGNVQVQRAGQEGFSHNEVNPNGKQNRMIQLWALPDQPGEPAGYKQYVPVKNGVTKIYGGAKDQKDTFDSSTNIDVVNVAPGRSYQYDDETMMYVVSGSINVFDDISDQYVKLEEGHLIRAKYLSFSSDSSGQCIVIS
jgi:redox-sensitive bicupin YhaK (pirin superfamily)